MAGVSIDEAASISRLAAALAPVVTNGIIGEVVDMAGLPADGSNKGARLRCLIVTGMTDGRRRRPLEQAIASLTVEAYDRAQQGSGTLTAETVDSILAEMRALRLDPGDLANRKWRSNLPRAEQAQAARTAAPGVSTTGRAAAHERALKHMRELMGPDSSSSPRLGSRSPRCATGW